MRKQARTGDRGHTETKLESESFRIKAELRNLRMGWEMGYRGRY